ncbi:MAG: domain 2, partial [Myxococcaceae bacterium]|nr:domain 2 [Myxococcaceae bacterium]
MDDGQWWVLRDGITLGPYGLEELRQYTKRGKLYADDLVSTAGETDWSPAALATPLSDLFPKDGSEDATVALDPALRALAAMTATPVPARRSHPSESPLRGSTLPPRLPT